MLGYYRRIMIWKDSIVAEWRKYLGSQPACQGKWRCVAGWRKYPGSQPARQGKWRCVAGCIPSGAVCAGGSTKLTCSFLPVARIAGAIHCLIQVLGEDSHSHPNCRTVRVSEIGYCHPGPPPPPQLSNCECVCNTILPSATPTPTPTVELCLCLKSDTAIRYPHSQPQLSNCACV
jgi:hypothetical protein